MVIVAKGRFYERKNSRLSNLHKRACFHINIVLSVLHTLARILRERECGTDPH